MPIVGCWDASQTVLFCLPANYLPLIGNRCSEKSKKYLIQTGLRLVCAIIVHPPNLLFMPITLWLSIALLKYDRCKGEICCAAIFLASSFPGLYSVLRSFSLRKPILVAILDSVQLNVVVLQPLWDFCRAILGLFTGESIYTSMSHTELGIAGLCADDSLFMIWGIFHYILT